MRECREPRSFTNVRVDITLIEVTTRLDLSRVWFPIRQVFQVHTQWGQGTETKRLPLYPFMRWGKKRILPSAELMSDHSIHSFVYSFAQLIFDLGVPS